MSNAKTAGMSRKTMGKIALLMAYTGEPREIEDPWYTDRYDVVYDEVDAGCEALLNELEQERRIKGKHYEYTEGCGGCRHKRIRQERAGRAVGRNV